MNNVRKARAGVTLFELMIALVVLVTALFGLLSAILAATSLQQSTREQTLAYNAARKKLEEMRNQTFAEVYARYNADPSDDPGGAGTGPGNTFTVDGLTSPNGQPVGRIVFPEAGAGGGPAGLREDVDDPEMGMPGGRDLNGDGVIDTNAHNADYKLLPVRIVVAYAGLKSGAEIRVNSLVAEK
ncbi:MAG: hypothetical protein HYY16_17310 [Planctomycetes bacterium]|nr:hypothetical protein [Planctomycetota bacterium]